MKPFKILLFLLSVFLMLSIVMLVFPKDGIKINSSNTLYFFRFEDFFTNKTVKYADISKILSENVVDTTATTSGDDNGTDTAKSSKNSLLRRIQHIEYPNNNPDALYPFFEALNGIAKSNELIRVLHYGDSQIEGDRITSFLRFKLQTKFGGCGSGFTQVNNPAPSVSIAETPSDNWVKYTLIGRDQPKASHNRYGAMLGFSRIALQHKDTTNKDSSMYFGKIFASLTNTSFQNTRSYQRLKLFYGYNRKDVNVKLYQNKELLKSETLPASKALNVLTWDFESGPSSFSLHFKGKDSPDVYGFALDGIKGIAIDNIPLRGSSGYGFSQTNFDNLKRFYDLLNVKLVIMQFGVNAVPENEKTIVPDYSYYEKGFYEQLNTLKKINKDLCIIVIGISDRSRKAGNYYETNPNIIKIRLAQKNAAFKAGCAYWDLYEAMGGENSMPSWVFAEPALANKDFTHFNESGARIVSEMFNNSLLNDYNEYLKQAGKLFSKAVK